MRNGIITLLLLLLFVAGFSQNSRYAYGIGLNPSAKKEKLSEAKSVSDITPELWRNLILPYDERYQLEQRLDHQMAISPPQDQYLYPQQNHIYPLEYYNKVIDYVSVEISATRDGKTLVAKGNSDALTTEQKNILNTADLGTDIHVKIEFRYKDRASSGHAKIIEGDLDVSVVPETEVEYPGGGKQINAYYQSSFISKIPEANASDKIGKAIVKFTINEDGRIVGAKIARTSSDPQIDQLLLDATNKMPSWKPAENSKGMRIKQEFSISFGGGGC